MDTIIKIPYKVFNDWDLLQQFLDKKGNPRYELIGDINLDGKKDIIDLGNLVRVGGNLYLRESSIKSLGNLVRVDGNLNLNYTPIKSLGNLQYVGGHLLLFGTEIQSLGNLQYVGGTIFLSEDHQIPEEQLTKFKNQIEYY